MSDKDTFHDNFRDDTDNNKSLFWLVRRDVNDALPLHLWYAVDVVQTDNNAVHQSKAKKTNNFGENRKSGKRIAISVVRSRDEDSSDIDENVSRDAT